MNKLPRYKFRVWCETLQKFFTPQWVDGSYGNQILYLHTGNQISIQNDPIIQQFTGLLDSEGEEVFEGDILQSNLFGGDDFQEVIFENGMFTCKNLTPGMITLHDEISQNACHRVVGNVCKDKNLYENY
jgi:hypothetical protein